MKHLLGEKCILPQRGVQTWAHGHVGTHRKAGGPHRIRYTSKIDQFAKRPRQGRRLQGANRQHIELSEQRGKRVSCQLKTDFAGRLKSPCRVWWV
jgi:hypothetical protein